MINILLDILSLGAIFSSVLVITSKNPVISIIFLISLFVNTAGYLLLIGVNFIGLSYIIIYIGAITVLFLFIIMMISIRLIDLLEIGKDYTKNFPLAIILGFLFVYEIFNIIPFTFNNIFMLNLPFEVLNSFNSLILNLNPIEYENNFNFITFSFNPFIFDFNVNQFLQIQILGQGLYSYGSIWLLICSFILLLSMISAIFISNLNKNI